MLAQARRRGHGEGVTGNPAFAIEDARWLAHRYDRASNEVLFRLTERSAHADAAFLTDEYLGEPAAPIVQQNREAAAGAAQAAPLHFLFHSAFCNSTLLCRALDRPGMAMGLSEPVILNDIVGIRRRSEVSAQLLPAITDHALTLLARPWSAGEAVVVKPSNILNPLAPGLMALRPDAKALLLHAPLPLFLNSVARKGMWCRLWVRELLEGLLTDGVADFGMSPNELFRLTDLQVAAIGWLAQHRLFHGLAARLGAERVRTLDSERLSANPAGVLTALGAHFGLAIDAALAEEISSGPPFTRHSKSGGTFSMAERHAEQAAAQAAHGEEIEKVATWAAVVAERAGIAITLPASLV
jgi:hypothetical protein